LLLNRRFHRRFVFEENGFKNLGAEKVKNSVIDFLFTGLKIKNE